MGHDNLYIGTSASEVLHFVAIPPEPGAETDNPTYILASRIQPWSVTNSNAVVDDTGVQKILVLPAAGKACILCNGVATFYSLPELSPVFGNVKVANCKWVGGLDENRKNEGISEQVIMIGAASRVMLVRIGEEARRVRNIEFPGCLRSTILYMDSLARLKTSRLHPQAPSQHAHPLSLIGHWQVLNREVMNGAQALMYQEFLLTTGTTATEPGVGLFVNVDGDVVRGTLEFGSYPEALVVDRPAERIGDGPTPEEETKDVFIVAVVMSKDSNDNFRKLLEIHDLGSGTDRSGPEILPLGIPSTERVGLYTSLSSFDSSFPDVVESLRLVRLRLPGSKEPAAYSADAPDPRTESSVEQVEREMALFESQNSPAIELPSGWESKREKEELDFARSLAQGQSRTVLWNGACIWNLARNPLANQLGAKLTQATTTNGDKAPPRLQPRLVMALMAQIRDRDPTSEAEFLSLEYIRQKASLMLFMHALQDHDLTNREHELRHVESALIESNLDPRVVLLMIPLLRENVIQAPKGIWLHRGVALLAEEALIKSSGNDGGQDFELLGMVRRYLAAWQGKRGFGSITDEKEVFDSVDASLLHTLLHLDQEMPSNSSSAAPTKAKLNNVVDNWKGDFDRAVTLLERYQRLFVLSRLYQSRKLSKDVLATWRRIIDGEDDPSGELTAEAGEIRVRKYLVTLRNSQLVEEYGLWLAKRNPQLAIQAFTDDSSRVKFEPAKLTELLKRKAPNAIQQYLEYLVFNKNQPQYGDDLIGYYLDSMLSVLETSEEARNSLADSYSFYRALPTPKPTYLTFITQNAPQQDWWQSRLRLLQLLGGGSTYAYSVSASSQLTYSIPTVLKRLAPFSGYLVSESIILDARQGHHSRALNSLIHGLGDYDTAIRYCYFGGPPPVSQASPIDSASLPSFSTQQSLFNHLLEQFLQIESITDRLERTSDLLSKFAAWFDPMDVLNSIPSDWSVALLSEFFTRTLRKIRIEKDDSLVLRGLAAAENLRKQVEWVEGCEKLGALFEEVEGVLKRGEGDSDDKKGPDGMGVGGDVDETASSIAEVREILGDDLVVS
ncbi:putative tgf beta receptor associated protein [Phaeomoniella chlamydospora]|uniref:Putative tgf beta receptor associated protein n=1 Tax=Phaeomoniella chlamydospora TaxID=158046 RepID=A0A0G2GKD9_PHACM|nr:putative tgf beta receptor associated protein [Phaeomoniella chlamydospora]